MVNRSAVDADVIVVGLGVMGSQTLWRLARRGVHVLGVEQFHPGHDHGSSHGESRMFRSTAYGDSAGYTNLLRHALRLWDALEAETGVRVLERTGGLVIGPPASSAITGALASAKAHGTAHERLSTAEIHRRYPQHRVTEGIAAVHDADAGLLRAEQAVTAGVTAAREHGATVLEGSTVQAVLPDPERPRVRLADRELTARHIVVAAGAWLPQLVPHLAQAVRVERRVMAWVRVGTPEDYGPARFPPFVRADHAGTRSIYGFPSLDGATMKVGLHVWPRMDETADPTAGGPRPPNESDAEFHAALVRQMLTGVDPHPIRMKACMYSLTPDRNFIVGRLPSLPGLTLLGGFSGHGFKFASAIGEIAARSALAEPPLLETAGMDPGRSALTAMTPSPAA